MRLTFFDRQNEANPLNGATISEPLQLREVLDVREARPHFIELIGENSFKLLIGLAHTMGCVQFSSVSGAPPYLMAVPSNADSNEGEMEFLIGNTVSSVPKRYCLPRGTLTRIAEEFLRSGQRSPDIEWEEI